MLTQLDKNSIANEIVTASTLIKVLTLRSFSEFNLEITPEQFVILDTVFKNKETYQRQIGKIIGKDRANVARLINILERKELIKKTISSNGRQINKIELTKKGETLRNKIKPVIDKIRNSYLSNVTKEEFEQCYNVLDKIRNNIEKNIKLTT